MAKKKHSNRISVYLDDDELADMTAYGRIKGFAQASHFIRFAAYSYMRKYPLKPDERPKAVPPKIPNDKDGK